MLPISTSCYFFAIYPIAFIPNALNRILPTIRTAPSSSRTWYSTSRTSSSPETRNAQNRVQTSIPPISTSYVSRSPFSLLSLPPSLPLSLPPSLSLPLPPSLPLSLSISISLCLSLYPCLSLCSLYLSFRTVREEERG
jgi:hypothetical protein